MGDSMGTEDEVDHFRSNDILSKDNFSSPVARPSLGELGRLATSIPPFGIDDVAFKCET